ncbi:hypothetical protein B296_00028449 [Ensete ventricosum]|uniref:Magnesium transporter n=1 Tax=Ensete ventricosum TaxID=4639 RepID=A0A426Z4N3_ENSVE|nr:hypothetical protein B296_00028449 [Ensete ventricosum]
MAVLVTWLWVYPHGLSSDSVSSCFPSACVFLVIVLTFASVISFSILIWIGRGKTPIDSSLVARVCFSGYLFCSYTPTRRCFSMLCCCILYELLSISLIWCQVQVASLAAVSVTCFTSSAVLALVTNIPVCCCPLLTYTFCATSSGLKLHLKISMFLCAAGGAFLLAFGTIRPHKQFSSYISLLFYRYA